MREAMTSSTTARRTTSGLSVLVAVTPARSMGEDRAAVIETNAGLRVALADGAGGTGGGARAADDAIAAILAAPEAPQWLDVLREIDRAAARGPGRCTAVVVELTATGLHGASVGDSGAWLFGDDAIDLTADQRVKPLVGDGAQPFAFTAPALGHRTLAVASDGLWRYARSAEIATAARLPTLEEAAAALLALVRLPSGGLQDDVAIVLVRALS